METSGTVRQDARSGCGVSADLRRIDEQDDLVSPEIHLHFIVACFPVDYRVSRRRKHTKGESQSVDQEGHGIQIPIAWVGVEEVPIFFANQVVCQFQQNEFILTFGQMSPPAILGATEEERAAQAE